MFVTELYTDQNQVWPKTGRHILAQFDAHTVLVYQAYNRAIASYAVTHQRFGGEFSFERMNWIKPNFLWMMFRSGWGTKENQEVVLALRLRRSFFDSLLGAAVASTWDREQFASENEWKRALEKSDVRLQWDPDHHPSGAPLERRAVQLGLRGDTLRNFAGPELLEVLDLSEFVSQQSSILKQRGVAQLSTPRERIYYPADPDVARHLRLDN